MSYFTSVFRTIINPKYRNKVILMNSAYRLQKCNRNIHCVSKLCAKMYMEHENMYAHSILESKGYALKWKTLSNTQSLTKEQFDDFLQRDWRKRPYTEILEVFPKLGVYCSENDISISNEMFDDYIDCITDCLKQASDTELQSVFYSLNMWPEPPSIRTRNHIEVWVALDDECLKRIQNWSHDELLSFVSVFYLINVIRYSDFTRKTLTKLAAKSKQLTPAQLVQTLFFIGIWRMAPFDMHNLELHLSDNFSQFSIDDLAIMSMGFFKSKTPLRDMQLVLKIIDSVIDNSRTIHEVSLAALLKIIRYSSKLVLDDRISRLLDALQYEVPRLSVMCNVHIALVGTSTLYQHTGCLTKIAETVNKSIDETRIKDLERLVLTYGTFNLIPKLEPCLISNIINELRKPEREEEIKQHGRSFACCVGYLGLLNIYPEDLVANVLSHQFLESTYGKQVYFYGREVLSINNSSQLFCSQANIPHLSPKTAKLLAKKYTDYVPSETYQKQYNVAEKMVLDILKVLEESRGGKEFVIGDHILPHHQRGDIIICNDSNGNPVPVKNKLNSSEFGQLRKPPDNNKWVVLVIVGRNAIVHNTGTPTGFFLLKLRELEKLGYYATTIPWNVYSNLESLLEKTEYLNKIIKECINRNK